MSPNPYERFRGQRLTLNDYLAIDRTELSNERTLLAYGRTAIALLVTGVSAIKFFDSLWISAVGAVFAAGAVAVAVIGARRYHAMGRRVAAALERQTGEGTHPLDDDAEKEAAEARKKAEAEKDAAGADDRG
jgi:putative membrane protein